MDSYTLWRESPYFTLHFTLRGRDMAIGELAIDDCMGLLRIGSKGEGIWGVLAASHDVVENDEWVDDDKYYDSDDEAEIGNDCREKTYRTDDKGDESDHFFPFCSSALIFNATFSTQSLGHGP